MIQAELSKLDGSTLKVFLPETCDEITYRAKLDFDTATFKLLNYLAEGGEFDSAMYFYYLCLGLSDFFTANGNKVDLATMFTIDISDLTVNGEIHPDILEHHIEMFKSEAPIDRKTALTTLTGVYEHITAVVKSYRHNNDQEDFSFNYKGEKFTVFKRYRDKLLSLQKYDKVSTGELMEAFEVSRKIQKTFKDAEKSDIEITHVLQLVAILARKDGEVFPFENSEQFIKQRANHFIDLSFQNGSDVFFYLTHSLNISERTQVLSGFLHHLNSNWTYLMNTLENK